MPDYDSLAALRQGLSADDADARASAYGAVMEHDVQPSEVLTNEPTEETLTTLREAGVIPAAGEAGIPANEFRHEVIDLLKQIETNTGGSA